MCGHGLFCLLHNKYTLYSEQINPHRKREINRLAKKEQSPNVQKENGQL